MKKVVGEKIRKETQQGSLEEQRLLMLDQTVNESLLIPPKFAQYPLVEDALWTSLQDGYTGKISVKEALEKAAEKANDILQGGGGSPIDYQWVENRMCEIGDAVNKAGTLTHELKMQQL